MDKLVSMDERIENFIRNDDTGQLCDFCTLAEECPRTIVCHAGCPVEPPCTDMDEQFVDAHIDRDAIADYLDGLGEEQSK